MASIRKRGNKYHISSDVTIGAFMGLGFMLLDGGHPKVAVELLNDAIKDRFPESIQLHRVLGRAYEKMGSYEHAFKAYEIMVLKAKQQKHPRLDGFEKTLEWAKKKWLAK